MLTELTQRLGTGAELTAKQIASAVEALIAENVPAREKADFLLALAKKGETASEIAGFAHALRDVSIIPPLDATTRAGEILDVCGTGGDRLNTFNISTTVALVMASAGVRVAKHGNRAVTSQAGSADVLEALGIKIDLMPAAAAACLRDHHFAFFFAPNYHPAFRHLAPARKLCSEQGQRTIFNFLGPLLNPARPTCQLVGVPRRELCEPIGAVLKSLGSRRWLVVCGEVKDGSDARYLDEFSTLGRNFVAASWNFAEENVPLQPATLADLAGSDRHANAEIVRRLLHGEERGPRRDAVLLNTAAAMLVAGKAQTIREGWELGAELIDSGRAGKKLAELIEHSGERQT